MGCAGAGVLSTVTLAVAVAPPLGRKRFADRASAADCRFVIRCDCERVGAAEIDERLGGRISEGPVGWTTTVPCCGAVVVYVSE